MPPGQPLRAIGTEFMKLRSALLAAAAFLASAFQAGAQEAPHVAELRFVRDLRARHYPDLALEYLERLRKNNPSPELLRELPLELAQTRLEAAAEEPDSRKRVALFDQARGDFEAFLRDNSEHPRAGEAKLAVARVVVLEGRTQLSRALSEDAPEARVAEGLKARERFVEAAGLLKKAADDTDAQIAALGEPKNQAERARRKQLDAYRLQARLAVALNLFDQAETYLDQEKEKVLVQHGKKVEEAARLLEALAGEDATSSVSWQARAWLGRCLFENGDPNKARAKLAEVINAVTPAAADGRRLARYFLLLVQSQDPQPDEARDPARFLATRINEASAWLVSYPNYARTPEGCGLRFLLAGLLKQRAAETKSLPQRDLDLARARNLLSEIEQTENDFSERARRLKIAIIEAQGGLMRDVASLKTFEDCYVRAQYEIVMMSKDAKPEKEGPASDEKSLEARRKQHAEAVVSALERGLTFADAKPDKGKVAPEVNNARAMLAYYCLALQRYRDAIRYGEGFARDDPRSGQAAMAAVYALDAYTRVIGQRERENALPEELRPEREKMLALARYMDERWPRELAGQMGRHQLALAVLREARQAKDGAEQTRLLAEAIKGLASIGKDYPSYVVAQYQLADACLQAGRDGLDPLPGQQPGDYRKRALEVLTALPEPGAGAEGTVNEYYVLGRVKLAWELYRDKQFEPARQAADELAKKLPAMPMDEAARQQLTANVTDLQIFTAGGLAEADFGKSRYEEVAARLDPLAAAVSGTDTRPEGRLLAGELKKNVQLGSALLGMDLRANVQLGRLERVEPVLKALQSLSAEGDDQGGTAKVLQTLAVVIRQQVDELNAKGDQENKEKAVGSFTKVLDKVAEQPDKLDAKSRLLLAQCYANMENHRRAAELLERAAASGKGGTPEEKGTQLLYARELRLGKELAKAGKVLADIVGTPKAPGWGARNVDALLEEVALLEDQGHYNRAALKANDVVRRLLPAVTRDNALKEKYFEAYYHVVFALVEQGKGLKDRAQREKALRQAAVQTVELTKKWPDYGGDASARRFSDLLNKESDFKAAVERVKAGNK